MEPKIACCEQCGQTLPASLADLRAARSTRKKGGGRKPSLDADGVKLAEKMLFDGEEISDIANKLVCSERTIRRVLNGEHKYSSLTMRF